MSTACPILVTAAAGRIGGVVEATGRLIVDRLGERRAASDGTWPFALALAIAACAVGGMAQAHHHEHRIR
jgi:hypothetical protein